MAGNHVKIDRQQNKDHTEPFGEAGGASGFAAGGEPNHPDQNGSGPSLKIGGGTLLAYLGGAAVLSVLVSLAAPILPPIAIGALLMCALLVVGWLTFVRRPPWNGTNGPVKVLRQELNVSRRQYQRLFSAVPDFICVLDKDHNIIEANDSYRRTFAADDRSLCYQVCKRRTTKCPHCVVDATFSDGVPRTEEEILVTRNGRRINALVHTQPIFDENLNINAVMEVFTDVTEVKRLQRQLALTGRAVAGTAHRIKNILMGLEGGIFIVNEALDDDDRDALAEGWEMVERNVHRVTAIVQDLLFTAKEREPEFEPDVCPRKILLEVRDLYAGRMSDDNIEIRAEVASDIHPGTFDPAAIHNLLCNLVGNAFDACRFDESEHKTGHQVVLRCRQNGNGDTTFEVEDNGAGITEDLTPKVFTEFFSSKGTEGTGIGLLVVQKIAEEHGGTVTFRSKAGEGTVFAVTIPSHRPLPVLQGSGDKPSERGYDRRPPAGS